MDKSNDNFTELYDFHASQGAVFISSEASFPTQDATTITIDSNTNFVLTASFSTAKRFIVQQGSNFTANNLTFPVLTYSGSDAMFTSADASFTMDRIRFNAPSASRGFDCTDTTGNTKGINLTSVFFENASEWGVFTSYQALIMSNCGIFASTGKGGVTTAGGGWFAFTNMGFAVLSSSITFIATDLGSSVHQFLELQGYVCIAPSGGIGIKGLTASANMAAGTLARVEGNTFIGGMTAYLSGIAQDDIRFDFDKNANIPNTKNEVDLFLINGAETITVSGAGDWVQIGTPSSGTVEWSSDIAKRFTVGTDGILTYIGERDIDVLMNGRATVEKSGGGSNILEVRIAKNWDGTTTDGGMAKTRAQTQNTDPTTVPIGGLTTLSNGDNIRVIFSNLSGTSNIIANVASLEITG
jgi:hypothetical protein